MIFAFNFSTASVSPGYFFSASSLTASWNWTNVILRLYNHATHSKQVHNLPAEHAFVLIYISTTTVGLGIKYKTANGSVDK